MNGIFFHAPAQFFEKGHDFFFLHVYGQDTEFSPPNRATTSAALRLREMSRNGL